MQDEQKKPKSIGEQIEEELTRSGATRFGDAYSWNGRMFPSFAELKKALNGETPTAQEYELPAENDGKGSSAIRGLTNAAQVILAVVVVAGIASFSMKSRNSTGADHDQSSMAHIQCNEFVKERLKVPSTADFPFLDFRATRVADNHYIVESHVDAQNAFGAKLRSSYFCDVEWNGIEAGDRRNWKLVALRLAD